MGYLRIGFRNRSVLCIAGLFVGMLCMAFSLCVCAAEEDSIPQLSTARLYTDKTDSSNIIANLIVGNGFEIISEELDDSGSRWYKVQTDFGVEGYAKADELDRLIIDANQMLYSAAVASAGVEPAAEGSPGEGGAEPEEIPEDEPAPSDSGDAVSPSDAVRTDGQQTPDAVQTDGQEQDAGHIDEEPVQEWDNAGEQSMPSADDDPAEAESPDGIAGQEGAGFGEMDDTRADTGSDGFTVIERTDKPEGQVHGKIDAVLVMIMAGGILCIIAIAALLRRMLACMRTGA